MKFFSLFDKEKALHSASKKKIIPKQEFETLLTAEELLQTVSEEGKQYIQEAKEEAKNVLIEAEKKGFEKGIYDFAEGLKTLDDEIKKMREEFTRKIIPLTMSAAKKILGEELKLHPERIVDIIIQTLKPVTQHRHIRVYVNKADLEEVEKHKTDIKNILEQVESFTVQERMDVEPGGCIIETEAGIINAQLENIWRAIEQAFKRYKPEIE